MTAWSIRRAGLALGALRAGLGVVAMARPRLVARPWLGAGPAGGLGTAVLGTALGGRDLALGLGALLARDSAGLAAWSAAGALADGMDVATTLAHWSDLPRRGRLAVLAAATGGMLTELAVAAALAPRRGKGSG